MSGTRISAVARPPLLKTQGETEPEFILLSQRGLIQDANIPMRALWERQGYPSLMKYATVFDLYADHFDRIPIEQNNSQVKSFYYEKSCTFVLALLHVSEDEANALIEQSRFAQKMLSNTQLRAIFARAQKNMRDERCRLNRSSRWDYTLKIWTQDHKELLAFKTEVTLDDPNRDIYKVRYKPCDDVTRAWVQAATAEDEDWLDVPPWNGHLNAIRWEWKPGERFQPKQISDALQTGPHPINHRSFGDGFGWSLPHAENLPARLEIFPEFGIGIVTYPVKVLTGTELRATPLSLGVVAAGGSVVSLGSSDNGQKRIVNCYATGDVDEFVRSTRYTAARNCTVGRSQTAGGASSDASEADEMTPSQAAKYLDTTPETVTYLLRKRVLAGRKQGGRWFADARGVEKYHLTQQYRNRPGPRRAKQTSVRHANS